MIIPIKCLSGKVLTDKYQFYKREVEKKINSNKNLNNVVY